MNHGIIDVHSHPLIGDYTRVTSEGRDDRTVDGVAMPPWSLEQHLATMDEHGIEMSVLSLPSLSDLLTGPEGKATARGLNEQLAELVAEYPDRLGAYAVVPMDDMDAANEEMTYALDELGMDGVTGAPQCRGTYLGEELYAPWFEEMDRRATTLFVHPGKPAYFDVDASRLNVSILEFMFETTRMVTSLVLSGTRSRFASMKVIATHGGGTIPYLAHRISIGAQMPWAYRDGQSLSIPEALAALGSIHYDLTASTSAAQLDAIKRLIPTERLLMGFDYPMMPTMTIAPAIASLEAYDGYTETEKSAIWHDNALNLIPRLRGLLHG